MGKGKRLRQARERGKVEQTEETQTAMRRRDTRTVIWGIALAVGSLLLLALLFGYSDKAEGESLVLQNGVSPDPLYNGIEDTWICSGYNTLNFGADDTLWCGRIHKATGCQSDSSRVLLRCDFADILPENAAINHITLVMSVLEHPTGPVTTLIESAAVTARGYFATSHLPWWGEGDNDWVAADLDEANWLCYREGYTPDSSWCRWGCSERSYYYEPEGCGDRTSSCDEVMTYVGSDENHSFDLTRPWVYSCYDSLTIAGYLLNDWTMEAETCSRCAMAWGYASSEYTVDTSKRPKFIIDYVDTSTVRTESTGSMFLGMDGGLGMGGSLTEQVIPRRTVGLRICGIADAHVGGHGPGGQLGLTNAKRIEQLEQQLDWVSALTNPVPIALFDCGDMIIDNDQQADYHNAIDDHLSTDIEWLPDCGNWEPSGAPAGWNGIQSYVPPDGRANPLAAETWYQVSYGNGALFFLALQNVVGGFTHDGCYTGQGGENDSLGIPGSRQYNFVQHAAVTLPADSWKLAAAHRPIYGCELYEAVRPNQNDARYDPGWCWQLEQGGFDCIFTGDQHVGYRTERIHNAVHDSGGWAADSPFVYLAETTAVYIGLGGARDRMMDVTWWPRWYWDQGDPPADSTWRVGHIMNHLCGKPDTLLLDRGVLLNWYQGHTEYKHGQTTYREADTTTYVYDMIMNGRRAYCRIVDVGLNKAPETVLDEWVLIREGIHPDVSGRAPRELVDRDTIGTFP